MEYFSNHYDCFCVNKKLMFDMTFYWLSKFCNTDILLADQKPMCLNSQLFNQKVISRKYLEIFSIINGLSRISSNKM